MNHHTSTIELYSQATGMKMGEFELTVGYDFYPPLSAMQDCPEDPAEVNIVEIRVKDKKGEWVSGAYMEMLLPDEFWLNLNQEIIETEV